MDRLYGERALHRGQRTQARVSTFKLLHDKPVRCVAKARAAVCSQVRSVKAQRAHPRNEMLRKLVRAMTENDLRQDFLLHKTPRPISRRAFFFCEKLFDAIIIQRGYASKSL